jgi:hypothetical protein
VDVMEKMKMAEIIMKIIVIIINDEIKVTCLYCFIFRQYRIWPKMHEATSPSPEILWFLEYIY